MFTTASIGVTGILLAVLLLMEVTAIVCLLVAHRRNRRSTLDASEPRLVLVFSPTGDEQHVPMTAGQAQ
ncbi:hypothetical protein ACTHQN_07340 [Curtobacterium flaccumfaciens]|uniref:hypothetical protein n=1 Tax=Curtobacterium flaccumfaciens TaxID=2035 RepID=UPI003F7F2446